MRLILGSKRLSVLTDLKNAIRQEIVHAAELTMPGNGPAFVIPVETVAGIVHLVKDLLLNMAN